MLSIAIIGIIALFSISSCKKVWDQIKDHPNGTADNCRIEKITETYININGDPVSNTAHFLYNNNGDPVRISYDASVFDIRQDKGFAYDNQHRLITYVAVVMPETNYGELWHSYTYVGNSKIIDSLFIYPDGDFTIDAKPKAYSSVRVSILLLDSWGRVTKETNSDGSEVNYTYDASGNLTLPGITYTNKTNIRQTSKTWMLIDRNFSVNQPKGDATTYNSNNLPVKLNDTRYVHFADRDYYQGKVTYSCK